MYLLDTCDNPGTLIMCKTLANVLIRYRPVSLDFILLPIYILPLVKLLACTFCTTNHLQCTIHFNLWMSRKKYGKSVILEKREEANRIWEKKKNMESVEGRLKYVDSGRDGYPSCCNSLDSQIHVIMNFLNGSYQEMSRRRELFCAFWNRKRVYCIIKY